MLLTSVFFISSADLNFQEEEAPQCGISLVPSGRIVGGEPVKPHSLPWQVRTGQNNKTVKFCGRCGGTLISKRHVLTAAHCPHHDEMTIWVGQHTREPIDGKPYKVCKVRSHPKYNQNTYDGYDFEILHLEEDVLLDETVQIACLPSKEEGLNDTFLDGKDLITSGWGTQKYLADDSCPNELHSVKLRGYSNERCQSESDYGAEGIINWESDRVKSIVCAREKGKDACNGDSGGPLIYYNKGRATVVGVVSTGIGCGEEKFPGIFGRVTSVLDWINDELNKTCSDFEYQKNLESEALSRAQTYSCKATPSVVKKDQSKEALTCALEGFNNGNHILYEVTKDGNHDVLTLWNVIGDRCEPKPEKCHCKTMLQKVLESNPQVDRIDGYMKADPFIAGCRCYLGVAARAGFKFVEDCDPKSKGRIEFTIDEYGKTCEAMQKFKCRTMAKIYKI